MTPAFWGATFFLMLIVPYKSSSETQRQLVGQGKVLTGGEKIWAE